MSPAPLAWLDRGTPIGPPSHLDRTLALVFAADRDDDRVRSWDHTEVDGRHFYWLACRGGIDLHTDDYAGRWQHQMVIRNDGWAIVGPDSTVPAEPLRPGDLYLLDAHSPHALARDRRAGAGPHFVAVGFGGEPTGPDEARRILETWCLP